MPATMTSPHDLLLHDLKDIYYAEKAIVKSLPSMIDEASDEDLVTALSAHLEETREQVGRVEQAFEALGEKPSAERCPGIDGLREEHDRTMKEEPPEGAELCDLVVVGSAARVEHYEIAAYSSMVALARELGETECARLLEKNLREEQSALEKVEAAGMRLAGEAGREAGQAAAR